MMPTTALTTYPKTVMSKWLNRKWEASAAKVCSATPEKKYHQKALLLLSVAKIYGTGWCPLEILWMVKRWSPRGDAHS